MTTPLHFTGAIPLSLYIHLPWCLQKCPYCDFNSHASTTPPYRDYVDALLRDLEWELPRVWGRPIRSIFIGGGTPSLFPAEEIARLLSAIRARLPLGAGAEITLEANPGTADRDHFAGYDQAGVNRLSIGVQSFHDQQLQAIGRIHSGASAVDAVEMAQKVGFERINIDLMFGLPQQQIEQSITDLQRAVALGVTHLSWYQLTMEPNTPFGHAPPPLPDDEAIWEMQEAGQQLLGESGFGQYEISAYAKPGTECRHNLNYWRFGDYLGIGAGAHAKVTHVNEGRIIRSARHRDPKRYMAGAGTEAVESSHHQVTASEIPLEFMMNRLRLFEPFTPQQYQQQTGSGWGQVEGAVAEAVLSGLLSQREEGVQVTEQGHRFLNDLLLLFQ